MTAKQPSQPPIEVIQFGLSNRDKKMKQNLPVRYVLLSKSPKTLNICSDFHPRHPLFCLCRGKTVMDFDNTFNYRQFRLTLAYNWGARLRQNRRQYQSDEVKERVVNDF